MAQLVKCGICGGLYNRRYLHGHMLRSHGKSPGETTEPELIENILSLAAKLSENGRKILLEKLAEPPRANSSLDPE